ncbi:hypothetical protein QJS10_CPA01g00698 [Acorus calamus]|uniref:R13L1/DRL21-like LRR repeat region domain-containing protein n=1 Tax=Acorus calamus TaxID=4465 RepID=A0AAV9FI92_ACOCL|nr:hypothetical protein QJS10_CPA01g00698 [Acorus calamus]
MGTRLKIDMLLKLSLRTTMGDCYKALTVQVRAASINILVVKGLITGFRETGFRISELKYLNNIQDYLELTSLDLVSDAKEAEEAELKKKQHIYSLNLNWNFEGEHQRNDKDVLERLQPHTNLDISFISLEHCNSLTPLGQLPSLSLNSVREVKNLVPESRGDSDHNTWFPALEKLSIYNMPDIETLSIGNGGQPFPMLLELSVQVCPKLVQVSPLPPQLKNLEMNQTELDGLPSWWGDESVNLPLLHLRIDQCHKLASIDAETLQRMSSLEGPSMLETLDIEYCPRIACLPEEKLPASLHRLSVNGCPELKE